MNKAPFGALIICGGSWRNRTPNNGFGDRGYTI